MKRTEVEKNMQHNGHQIDFTRRRYGRNTFTWIYVRFGDKWQSTGDPVRKIIPSKKDLDEAIKRAHANYRAEFAAEKKKSDEIRNEIASTDSQS